MEHDLTHAFFPIVVRDDMALYLTARGNAQLPQEIRHDMVSCDGCGQTPLLGTRHRCLDCAGELFIRVITSGAVPTLVSWPPTKITTYARPACQLRNSVSNTMLITSSSRARIRPTLACVNALKDCEHTRNVRSMPKPLLSLLRRYRSSSLANLYSKDGVL